MALEFALPPTNASSHCDKRPGQIGFRRSGAPKRRLVSIEVTEVAGRREQLSSAFADRQAGQTLLP